MLLSKSLPSSYLGAYARGIGGLWRVAGLAAFSTAAIVLFQQAERAVDNLGRGRLHRLLRGRLCGRGVLRGGAPDEAGRSGRVEALGGRLELLVQPGARGSRLPQLFLKGHHMGGRRWPRSRPRDQISSHSEDAVNGGRNNECNEANEEQKWWSEWRGLVGHGWVRLGDAYLCAPTVRAT